VEGRAGRGVSSSRGSSAGSTFAYKLALRLQGVAADHSDMATFTSNRVQLTVARALVESADGRVLLVRRAAWDTMPGMWELPGGKVDRGEKVMRALARELEEETGLMFAEGRRISQRDMTSPRGRRVREHVYAVSAIGTVTLSDEHDAYAWVDSPDGLELTDSAEAAFSLVS